VLSAPELDAGLLGGLSRVEQRGRIPSIALLATLLGMQLTSASIAEMSHVFSAHYVKAFRK